MALSTNAAQMAAASPCVAASRKIQSSVGSSRTYSSVHAALPSIRKIHRDSSGPAPAFPLTRDCGRTRRGVVQRSMAAGIRASIDPSKLAAEIQQSRPAAGGQNVVVGGTGGALAQPGSLQASMAEELDEVEDEDGNMSSEGNLAQSDVEPAESSAVQEAADRAASGDADTFKGSRLISVEDGPKPSDEPAYRAATEKVVDVEAEKDGDVFRGSKLLSVDEPVGTSTTQSSTDRPSTMSSEGNLAQSDVEPAESEAVQRAADRAANMSSEGNLAQSDVEPAESDAVQRAADRAANMSSEGNLAQSDVEPAESEAVQRAADEAAGKAKSVSEDAGQNVSEAAGKAKAVTQDARESVEEDLEKGARAVKEGAEKGERVVKEGAEKGEEAAKEGFENIAQAVQDLDDPEKLAKKIPEPVKEGLLNATLLKEYVEEKAGNLVNEFKGQVKEAKADDKLKEVVQEAKDATDGASKSVKDSHSSRYNTSQEGNLAESDIAPAESDAVERTADALSHKQQPASSSGHNISQEGNLAESDVAPAQSAAVERTADALSHKQQGSRSGAHRTSQEGNLAESDVAPAESAAVERTADSLSHKEQIVRESAVKTRVQERLGVTSTTDDVGSNKHTLEVIEAHEKLKEGKKVGRPGAADFQRENKERTAVSEASKKLDEAKSAGRHGAAVFEDEAKARVQKTGGWQYK